MSSLPDRPGDAACYLPQPSRVCDALATESAHLVAVAAPVEKPAANACRRAGLVPPVMAPIAVTRSSSGTTGSADERVPEFDGVVLQASCAVFGWGGGQPNTAAKRPSLVPSS